MRLPLLSLSLLLAAGTAQADTVVVTADRMLDVVTGQPPRLAVVTSYASPALANTSSGPVTSRLCTPSNKTISTVRGTSPSVLASRSWQQ